MVFLSAALAAITVGGLALVALARARRREQATRRELLDELGRLYAEIDALQETAAHLAVSAPPQRDLDVEGLLRQLLVAALHLLRAGAGTASCELAGTASPIVVSSGIEDGLPGDLPLVLSMGAPPGVEMLATRFVESINGDILGPQVLSAVLLHEPEAEATLTVYQPAGGAAWTAEALAELERLLESRRPALAAACRVEARRGAQEAPTLEAGAARELERAQRYGRPLSVMCMSVAPHGRWTPHLRSTDHAAAAGDVLTLVLTETSFAGARRCFDRMAAELTPTATCHAGIAEAFPGERFVDVRQRALAALASTRHSAGPRAMIAPGPCATKPIEAATLA